MNAETMLFLILSIVICLLLWFKGGKDERRS